MSRDLTDAFKAALTGKKLYPIFLAAFEFPAGTVRFWTGYGDLVWNGDTYTGAGDLLRFSPAKETQNIEATGAQFELSGIPSSLIATALGTEYQDRPCKLWFGAIDSGDGALSVDGEYLMLDGENLFLDGTGTPGGMIADPFLMFSGRMDVMEIEDGAETAMITLSAESRLIDLKRVKERRYTPEDQKQKYPNDEGLDFVSSLQDAEITWGSG